MFLGVRSCHSSTSNAESTYLWFVSAQHTLTVVVDIPSRFFCYWLSSITDQVNFDSHDAVLVCRNLQAVQDREICCYSISCKERHNIGKKPLYIQLIFRVYYLHPFFFVGSTCGIILLSNQLGSLVEEVGSQVLAGNPVLCLGIFSEPQGILK